ncbi:MAG: hypothetical protein ACSLE9_07765 [Burkholderiaceae bacterium]
MTTELDPQVQAEIDAGLRRPVNISAAMARQIFHGCEPDYIANVCHAKCCESSTQPGGTLITVLPGEELALRARGGEIIDGLLQPVARRCPMKTEADLCGLHDTPDKPFGCIASPWMLTKRQTLIVRNRYRLLKCYRDGTLPAYRAFASGLVLMFGAAETERITAHLEAGGGNLLVWMLSTEHDKLAEGDWMKRATARRYEKEVDDAGAESEGLDERVPDVQAEVFRSGVGWAPGDHAPVRRRHDGEAAPVPEAGRDRPSGLIEPGRTYADLPGTRRTVYTVADGRVTYRAGDPGRPVASRPYDAFRRWARFEVQDDGELEAMPRC